MKFEARNLTKAFPAPLFSGARTLRALDGVNFEGGPGVTGVEGPNGSGKTTLFRALAGVLEADGGQVLADGGPAGAEALRCLAAFCPANPRAFYFRLSAAENLRFFGALAGLSPREAAESALALAGRLGLAAPELHRRFDHLSEGNMQKVSLIRAFSRSPRLLLLDEPFRGLDAAACSGLTELIKESGRDRAVVISSHSPELLRAAAGRIVRMEAGRLI
jgi:ABC-type multidrug transport system ATPase subunit